MLPTTMKVPGYELFNSMITAAQVIFATAWKNEVCTNLENWTDKMTKHATVAKLTLY